LTGAFAVSVSILAARPFYAMQKTVLPMAVSTAVSLLSIPLYYLFGKQMGPKGLGLASGVAGTAQFVVLYAMWGRRYGGFGAVRAEAVKLAKIVAVSAAGAAVCYFANGIIGGMLGGIDSGRPRVLAACAAASAAALAAVFALYELLKLHSLREIIKR
jgi:peptidoglycan biosynthesis protein MviN/MurJ (putative lipid II flippase)